MKFKTYKAAKNYLIAHIERSGIDVRDVNLDSLMVDLFTGTGVGANFELEMCRTTDTLPSLVRALRVPRRGTVSDEQWEAAVRRLGGYMGMFYTAEDADSLADELAEQALFIRHMLEEAL